LILVASGDGDVDVSVVMPVWIFGGNRCRFSNGTGWSEGCRKKTDGYPLVNCYITMENHHFSWVNQRFLWPFSIAMLVYWRVDKLAMGKGGNGRLCLLG